MKANPKCWSGPPKCDGLSMHFYAENSPLRQMFLNGELDILDLDKLGIDAEYFLRGDIYRKNVIRGHPTNPCLLCRMCGSARRCSWRWTGRP